MKGTGESLFPLSPPAPFYYLLPQAPPKFYHSRIEKVYHCRIPIILGKNSYEMKIFMSWSGDQSRLIAEQFRSFLTKIIQQSQPYISSKDIDLGSVWSHSILKEATERRFGLIFITPENKQSPWIHYEAGCLIKDLEKDRVVPILFGLRKEDIAPPISMFQMIEFSKESSLNLLKQINEGTPNPLSFETLNELFLTFFPKIEKEISTTMNIQFPSKTSRPTGEILDEILLLTRENKVMISDVFQSNQSLRNFTSTHFSFSNDEVEKAIHQEKFELFRMQLEKIIDQGASKETIHAFLNTIPDNRIKNSIVTHYIKINNNKD